MNVKRSIAILLIVLSGALLFAACGNGTHELDPAFDEEALIDKGKLTIERFTKSDWDAMGEDAYPEMQEFFADPENRTQLDDLREPLGDFKEYGDVVVSGATDAETGVEFALVMQEAVYENRKALFTMSFTKDMELAGFYIR